MTPEFAAPEQVRGTPISTATDVYSLGVLLYLLLTGERPYDVRGKSPAEIERIVCADDPAEAVDAGAPPTLQRAAARRSRSDRDDGAAEAGRSGATSRQRRSRRTCSASGKGARFSRDQTARAIAWGSSLRRNRTAVAFAAATGSCSRRGDGVLGRADAGGADTTSGGDRARATRDGDVASFRA